MDFLTKIWSTLKAEFAFIFTNVSGVISATLSELPDDEVAILHNAMNAFSDAMKSGTDFETSVTIGLNTLYNGEVTEARKIGEAFFTAFTLTAKPAAATA